MTNHRTFQARPPRALIAALAAPRGTEGATANVSGGRASQL